MSMKKIKIGDTVMMLVGKDKDKSGEVISIKKGSNGVLYLTVLNPIKVIIWDKIKINNNENKILFSLVFIKWTKLWNWNNLDNNRTISKKNQIIIYLSVNTILKNFIIFSKKFDVFSVSLKWKAVISKRNKTS